MGSLVDTNVVSEFRNPSPNAGVVDFLGKLEFGQAYLSVVTLSEIRYGVDRLPDGARKRDLERWLSDLPLEFGDRILSVSQAVAEVAGAVRAAGARAGRPIGIMDAFLAATAQVHDLTLVTRNVRDFEIWGGPTLNPWSL